MDCFFDFFSLFFLSKLLIWVREVWRLFKKEKWVKLTLPLKEKAMITHWT